MAVQQRPLTPKQTRFVAEYLCDLNATQAALRAGYSVRNSDKLGPRLVGQSRIASAIHQAQRQRAQRVKMTQDEVLEEYKVLSRSDIRHYTLSETGDLLLAEGAPDYAMRAVASMKKRVTVDVEGTKTYHVEFRLWDKPGTLRLTSQHLGMLVEKVELSGPKGGPIQLEALTADQRQARLAELLSRRNGHTPSAPAPVSPAVPEEAL